MGFFNQRSKHGLERVERAVIHAAASPEPGHSTSLSAFLYPRIKARIESERRLSTARSQPAFTQAVWRYSPALVLVTCVTFVLFLVVSFSVGRPLSPQNDELLEAGRDEFERVVITDPQPLSRDEILATIMTSEIGWDPQ